MGLKKKMRNICWSSKQLSPQVSRLQEDAAEGGAPPTPAASVLCSRDSPRKVPSQHDDSRLLPNRKRSRNSKPTLLPGLQEAKPVTTGGRLVSSWRRQEVGDWENDLRRTQTSRRWESRSAGSNVTMI